MPRVKKRAGGGGRGRPSAIARISTAELRRELERRQGRLQDLVRQRDQLSAELQELESAFGATSRGTSGRRQKPGRPAGKRGRTRAVRRGRGANKTSLVTALQSVLSGKTMSVSDVAEQVQKAGYKTTSANFRTIVNQALLANPDRFRKVARGEYTARS